MSRSDLQGVADAVLRRARRQGFVVAEDLREELAQAGLADARWEEVVALLRDALTLREGRYYHAAPASERARQEQHSQQAVQEAVRQLIRDHQAVSAPVERRGQDRIDFLQTVRVRAEDGREWALLSRDLSTSGMRLVSGRSLLGQKLRVLIPRPGAGPQAFLLRVLWTSLIGDGLFENGGTFLRVEAEEGGPG